MGANLIIALMVSVACAVSCNPVLSACPTQRWVWPTVRLNLRLRGGVQAEEGDECAGNSDLFQRLGFDDYVSKEVSCEDYERFTKDSCWCVLAYVLTSVLPDSRAC